MEDGRLRAALMANTAFLEALGRAGEGARIVRPDGVLAAVVPICPERSVFNSVVYDDASSLAAAYDDLELAYAGAGVQAWTVWVPSQDHQAIRLLAERGHRLDAAPAAMAMGLEGVGRPPRREPADWTRSPHPGAVGRVNDLAYGYDGSFERALGALPAGSGHWYIAELAGSPACGLMTIDHGTDADVNMVATAPGAQRRGLATALLRHALFDARERGMATTSLVATPAGRPIYERLGYRTVATLEMWEKRRA